MLAGIRLNAKTCLWLALTVCGIVLVWVAVLGAVVALFFIKDTGPWLGALGVLLALGLSIWLSISFAAAPYRFGLAIARHKSVSFREVVQPSWRLGWQLTLAKLLAGLIILGGFLLLIVPGVIFTAWYSFVGYVVVDEGLTGRAALRRSKELAAHRFWDVWGALSLPGIFLPVRYIPIVGQFLQFVAILLFLPLPALRYHQLRELKATSDGADVPVSGWNYLVFIIMVIGSIWSTTTNINHLREQSKVENPGNSY
ncbi:MAG: hypothetical protein JWN01_515 [Patescibacteria group bacterium]|nr:hypothetical protein [Patescibacteria group bacterium]